MAAVAAGVAVVALGVLVDGGPARGSTARAAITPPIQATRVVNTHNNMMLTGKSDSAWNAVKDGWRHYAGGRTVSVGASRCTTQLWGM